MISNCESVLIQVEIKQHVFSGPSSVNPEISGPNPEEEREEKKLLTTLCLPVCVSDVSFGCEAVIQHS